METIGYIASFAMGIVLGLMGGGGSILTVPILVYLFKMTPVVATGYSLFIVGLTALVGSLMSIRKGDVDFKVGFSFAIPSIVGVNVSRAFVLPAMPDVIGHFEGFIVTKAVLIMVIFAVLMIVASVSMISQQKVRPRHEGTSFVRVALTSFQGLLVGVIAGFVGAGGGFLIIPALVVLAGLTIRVAVGTSLMIIALQSLTGFGGDLMLGATFDWPLLASVAAVAACGIILGSALAHKLKEKKLQTAFGWFILIMGAAILIEQVYQISSK